MNNSSSPSCCNSGGTIVVVSKCPLPGKSKTRLIPLLGSGSTILAKAMLVDVLTTLSQSSHLTDLQVNKVLLYAPGDNAGYHVMKEILDSVSIKEKKSLKESGDGWVLLPMESNNDLKSSDLGSLLSNILHRVQKSVSCSGKRDSSSVCFLGMDSPELPLDEIIYGLSSSLPSPTIEQLEITPFEQKKILDNNDNNSLLTNRGTALLCPSNDGGYGMLCIPLSSPLSVFDGIIWSNSLTALSQIKAITDLHIPIRIGRLMYDVDEADDVYELCKRLCYKRNNMYGGNENTLISDYHNNAGRQDVLSRSNSCCDGNLTSDRTGQCHHTWKALVELGLIIKCNFHKSEKHLTNICTSKNNEDHERSWTVATEKFKTYS